MGVVRVGFRVGLLFRIGVRGRILRRRGIGERDDYLRELLPVPVGEQVSPAPGTHGGVRLIYRTGWGVESERARGRMTV